MLPFLSISHFCGGVPNGTIHRGPQTFAAASTKCNSFSKRFNLHYNVDKLTGDPTKVQLLKGTFTNMEKFLGNLLKCADLPSENGYDYVITVNTKVQPSGIIATAYAELDLNLPCTRPKKGVIDLDIRRIFITKSEDFNPHGEQTDAFSVLLHETFHAIGISKDAMYVWIDPMTGTPRGIENIATEYTAFSTIGMKKTQFIVHSPNAHQFAVKRWGKEKFFKGKVPAGIEMEDSNGFGDQSHPEMRLYRPDLMCSVLNPGITILSHVTLTLLKDTGWWDINWEFAQTNPWGDASLVGDSPYTTFPDGTQTIDWPQYLQYKTNGYYCDPTMRAGGRINERINPSAELCTGIQYKAYCEMQSYYDPKGYGATSDDAADYISYVLDYRSNPPGQYVCGNMPSGTPTFCALSNYSNGVPEPLPQCFMMTCDDGVMRIHVTPTKKFVCEREGQVLYRTETEIIICPKPCRICHLLNPKYMCPPIKYVEGVGEVEVAGEVEGPASKRKTGTKRGVVIAVVVIVLVCLALVGVYVGVFILRKNKKEIPPV